MKHAWIVPPMILALVLGAFLYIANSDPGFHRITENYEAKQETYKVVVGTVEVDVLDEEGKSTGEKITRPVTEDETRYWTKKTITQGGPGVTFTDFGSGNTPFFLGRDVKELLANGHKGIVRDYMAVTYLSQDLDEEGRRVVKRVAYRAWGGSDYISHAPKYHYSGTPSVNLTSAEFWGLD